MYHGSKTQYVFFETTVLSAYKNRILIHHYLDKNVDQVFPLRFQK